MVPNINDSGLLLIIVHCMIFKCTDKKRKMYFFHILLQVVQKKKGMVKEYGARSKLLVKSLLFMFIHLLPLQQVLHQDQRSFLRAVMQVMHQLLLQRSNNHQPANILNLLLLGEM